MQPPPAEADIHPSYWRVACGLLVAPGCAAIAMAIFDTWPAPPFADLQRFLSEVFLIMLIGAYPPALLLGVPAYLSLRYVLGLRPRLPTIMLIGAIVAVLPWPLLGLWVRLNQASRHQVATVLYGHVTGPGWPSFATDIMQNAGFGAFGGFVFWLIVTPRITRGHPPVPLTPQTS